MRTDLRVADPRPPVPGPGVALHRRWLVPSWLPATLLLLLPAELSAQESIAPACPDGAEPAELRGTPACLQEVAFPSADLTLAGQWFTPRGEGPFPAVVVIRGSGESRRGNVWTESLARVLVDEGVGVLLPDKRGSGASEGDWRTADFHDLAGDALAGVRFVAARADVMPDRIGVMGLSQGGQVAPIAAARSESVAFVIDVVGAAVPSIENVRYEMLQTFREEGLSGARLEAAMEMVDTAVGYVGGEVSWEAYEAALDEKSEALGDAILDAYFIPTPDHWRWDFFRRMADFDPLDWWREVRQPTLVLLGGADRNTPTAESARRLEEAFEESRHPDATVRTFQGLGHALWDTSGPMSEHGLDAAVRKVLASWVQRVAAPRRAEEGGSCQRTGLSGVRYPESRSRHCRRRAISSVGGVQDDTQTVKARRSGGPARWITRGVRSCRSCPGRRGRAPARSPDFRTRDTRGERPSGARRSTPGSRTCDRSRDSDIRSGSWLSLPRFGHGGSTHGLHRDKIARSQALAQRDPDHRVSSTPYSSVPHFTVNARPTLRSVGASRNAPHALEQLGWA